MESRLIPLLQALLQLLLDVSLDSSLSEDVKQQLRSQATLCLHLLDGCCHDKLQVRITVLGPLEVPEGPT